MRDANERGPLRFTGLWRHADFLKLWAGETISVFGSMVTGLALPYTAAELLKATPAQMGILGAAATLPWLLIGLFAGVWVDRLRRRPLLIGADMIRALLLGLIPLLWWRNLLWIEHLYVIEFLVGIMTVVFDVAYQSYLPALISREHLVEGNSKLEVSRSSAQIAGPGLAGLLIQLVTAPIAIVVDAISFAISALFLATIRTIEPSPDRPAQRRGMWREIGEGVAEVVGNNYLRPMAGYVATFNLFSSMLNAVFILYLTRDLRLQPAVLGVIFAVGAPGALLGALLASRAAQRFGLGATLIGSAMFGGVGMLFTPLADGPLLVAAPLLIVGQLITGLMIVVYNVNAISLRQTITPDRLLGRMTASMRFMVWGIMPIGSLIGGALGESIGLRPTLFVAAAGTMLAFVWLMFSPLRALREQPPSADETLASVPVDQPAA